MADGPARTDRRRSQSDLSVAPLLTLPALLREFGVDRRMLPQRHRVAHGFCSPTDQPARSPPVPLVDCGDDDRGLAFAGLLVGQRSAGVGSLACRRLLDDAASGACDRTSRYRTPPARSTGAVLYLLPMERGRSLWVLVFHPGTPGGWSWMRCSRSWWNRCARWRAPHGDRPSVVRACRAAGRANLRGRPRRCARVRARNSIPRRFGSSSRPATSATTAARRRVMRVIETDERGHAERRGGSVRVVRVALLVGARRRASLRRSACPVGGCTSGSPRRAPYSELLADIRCEIARQLLEGTHMPAGEIATALHYSSPGAFSRAFRAWTGVTPQGSALGKARVPRAPRGRRPGLEDHRKGLLHEDALRTAALCPVWLRRDHRGPAPTAST